MESSDEVKPFAYCTTGLLKPGETRRAHVVAVILPLRMIDQGTYRKATRRAGACGLRAGHARWWHRH